jgi:hypothetical protein
VSLEEKQISNRSAELDFFLSTDTLSGITERHTIMSNIFALFENLDTYITNVF